MRRFYIDKEHIENNTVTIEGREARHLGNVLRMREQDSIHLFAVDGTVYTGTIVRKDAKRITVRIDTSCAAPVRDDSQIILAQAIPKGKKMDLIVQKATELGVTRIIPFSSLRTIARYDEQKEHDRVRHWQQIAVESAKQSGTRHVPAVEGIVKFPDLLQRSFEGYVKIILWEEEKNCRLRQIFQSSRGEHKTIFVVGPEGGFDAEEVVLARSRGFCAVSLGDSVLRTETVSMAVLSLLRYEAGDFG
jgi:16S rRNA (uracil1498-N3)-methyltransferase